MFYQGSQGKQPRQRRRDSSALPLSPSRRRSLWSLGSHLSALDVRTLSINNEVSVDSKPGSANSGSNSRAPKSRDAPKSSSIQTAGTREPDVAERLSRRRSDVSFDTSFDIEAVMKRGQLIGGQRLATKRLSLMEQQIRILDGKTLWRKLKLWVRIRGILGRLHQKVVDWVIHDPSSPFYMQYKKEGDDDTSIDRNHYTFFDPSDYKANRQMRSSQEVRRILTLPPEQRTSDEIHCAMIGLRGIGAIAEYPIRMQRYLAEYGSFECYEAKRAIVRQGRPPEAFYYILYGRVLVAVRDEVTGRVEIKCYLHRGHEFGELAIINNTNRQSSVITKNYTELLHLSTEVFQKYFMVGGVKNISDPDQNNFVGSLSFLNGWPLELVLQNRNQENVTFGYFKRGSVLVKDSNYSDWLIIVKSGSLTVLKKLVKVLPTVSKKTGLPRTEANFNNYLSFLYNNGEYVRYLKQSKTVLPPPFAVPENENSSSYDDDNSNEYRNENIVDAVTRVGLVNRPHTVATELQLLDRKSKSLWSATRKLGNTNSIVEFKSDTLLLKMKSEEKVKYRPPRTKKERSVSRDLGEDAVLEIEDKRTFLDDLDSAYSARAHVVMEADLNPQFVFVQTLTKGDDFGLAQCLFCDQPSLCVVSNGSDCLLLNKQLFLDNCSSALINRLRVEVSPYPSEEKLQEDLTTRINWDMYKRVLRKQLYSQHKKRSHIS